MQEVIFDSQLTREQLVTKFTPKANLIDLNYSPLVTRKLKNLKVKELEVKFNQSCSELEQLDKLESKLKDYLSQADYLDTKLLAKHKHIKDNIIIVQYRLIKLEERREALNEELKVIVDELDDIPNDKLVINSVLIMPLFIENLIIEKFGSWKTNFATLIKFDLSIIKVCQICKHMPNKIISKQAIPKDRLKKAIIYMSLKFKNFLSQQKIVRKLLVIKLSSKVCARIRGPDPYVCLEQLHFAV